MHVAVVASYHGTTSESCCTDIAACSLVAPIVDYARGCGEVIFEYNKVVCLRIVVGQIVVPPEEA